MLFIYLYISVHLHLFISVFLCPYVNEVGGPNLSQEHDWLQECAGGEGIKLTHCKQTDSRPEGGRRKVGEWIVEEL